MKISFLALTCYLILFHPTTCTNDLPPITHSLTIAAGRSCRFRTGASVESST